MRDLLLGRAPKDVDVEVFGLSLAELRRVLTRHGPVAEIGHAFGVLHLKGLEVDFALPRAPGRDRLNRSRADPGARAVWAGARGAEPALLRSGALPNRISRAGRLEADRSRLARLKSAVEE